MNRCQFFNQMVMQHCEGFPGDYQRVEFLQSSGTQYINTGVRAANGIGIKAKVIPTIVSANSCVCGARTTSSNRFFLWSFNKNDSKVYYGYRDAYTNTGKGWSVNTEYDIESYIGTTERTIKRYGDDGWTVTASISTQFSGSVNLYLFASNDNGTGVHDTLTGRIYSCTIYNSDGNLRNFIPCYRKSDNKPGMYDLVSGTFYTNAGTGEFTVGSDV